MFHPVGHPMERGWVGRVDGDRVVHLAAQTLQSFFSGGGSAREHAEYPLAEVQLLAPVLHPPSIRVFDDESSFAFANPAAMSGTGLARSPGDVALVLAPRIAALIGAEGAVAGFTILAEWRDPARRPPKDRDFALGLGPVVVTPDAFEPGACVQVVLVDGAEVARLPVAVFDWAAATALAAERTRLYPGDLLAGPRAGSSTASPGQRRRDRRRRHRHARAPHRAVADGRGRQTPRPSSDEPGSTRRRGGMRPPCARRSCSTGTAPSPTATRCTRRSRSSATSTSSARWRTRSGGASRCRRSSRWRWRRSARPSTRWSRSCSTRCRSAPGSPRSCERYDPLVVSMGFHELIEPAARARRDRRSRRREPARPAARRVGSRLQAAGDVRRVR